MAARSRGRRSITFGKLQLLNLYATSTVVEAVSRAHNAAFQWSHQINHDYLDDPRFYELQAVDNAAEIEVLFAIRDDLSLPGDHLTGVG